VYLGENMNESGTAENDIQTRIGLAMMQCEAAAPPSSILAVPNVPVHSSTATVYQLYILFDAAL